MIQNIQLITKKDDIGKRIDLYLTEQITDLSRNQIKVLIAEGAVSYGYEKVTEAAMIIDRKNKITVRYDNQKSYKLKKSRRKERRIHVLFYDKDLIVIEKDTGVLSVPSDKKEKDTAMHLINDFFKNKYQQPFNRVYPVHRLDQATSGLLIYARNESTQKLIKDDIVKKKVLRKYIAIVDGILKDKKGKLESYLDLSDTDDYKVKASKNPEQGIQAITHYIVRKEIANKYSVLELSLDTGKRNQIRVQLAEIGHPVMGDKKYSHKKSQLFSMPRLALHAAELKFTHPLSKKNMHFKSLIPQIFQEFIKQLSK